IPCGTCFYCERGMQTSCDRLQTIGVHRDGGFAQYVMIPLQAVKQRCVIPIPEGVSFEEAALIDPASCAINACELSRVKVGDVVVVIGAGPVGCLNVEVCRAFGAQKIILVQRSLPRLKQAEFTGANVYISPLREDVVEGIPEKIEEFEDLLAKLKIISEKELSHKELSEAEYSLIGNIGGRLASLKRFPEEIMKKITSGTDEKIDLIADVHTDPNTNQVLEEGVGSPFNIYVIIEDDKGYRLCRGGVFSYYEFKHPMKDRLTDEKWQEMGKNKTRPPQPDWVRTFTAK
ncbi:MAG: DUF3160 domain-containing protein, partial [Firmicutes bacterium]|nr:DUF3160 domain-containing protein [Bacillota bacterium]